MPVASPKDVKFTNERARSNSAEQAVIQCSKTLPSWMDANEAVVKCTPEKV